MVGSSFVYRRISSVAIRNLTANALALPRAGHDATSDRTKEDYGQVIFLISASRSVGRGLAPVRVIGLAEEFPDFT